jgi:thiamine-monophosphate kinase
MIETILTGGDDFEIVATIPPRKLKAFLAAARRIGVPVAEIGRVIAGEGARFRDGGGRMLTFRRASFSHF